jgi:O-antigen/teichoic acid export membrane protein
MSFKRIGLIEMVATIISCFAMLAMAHSGWGVWTLLTGRIIRSCVHMVFVYLYSKWLPDFHFQWKQAIIFIRFGIVVSLGGSLFYVWEKSDRFFAGRAWSAQILGYYTFALQLAAIPTEKIVSLINQVTYPALSKVQNNPGEFNNLYLNITKMIALLILPLFTGGFLLGDYVIKVMLNEKWYQSIFIFRLLCISQIFVSLNTINSLVHNAKGKPLRPLIFNSIAAVLMPLAFFIASKHTLNSMAFPWLLVYSVLCVCWAFFTVKTIGIGIVKYLQNFFEPFLATIVMGIVIILFKKLALQYFLNNSITWLGLALCVIAGGSTYIGFLFMVYPQFTRQIINKFSNKKDIPVYTK